MTYDAAMLALGIISLTVAAIEAGHAKGAWRVFIAVWLAVATLFTAYHLLVLVGMIS